MLRSVVVVGALTALGCAGCASAPPPSAGAPPRLILADATPAPADSAPAAAAAPDAPVPTDPASPASPVSAPPASGATQQKSEPNTEHKDRQMHRVWGWFALGVGIDAGILALVTSGMMLHQASVRSADCDAQKACSSDGYAANGKLSSLAAWNATAWGLGVVGGAVGTYLLLTNPTDEALHTQIVVGQTGSGSGLLVKGAF